MCTAKGSNFKTTHERELRMRKIKCLLKNKNENNLKNKDVKHFHKESPRSRQGTERLRVNKSWWIEGMITELSCYLTQQTRK